MKEQSKEQHANSEKPKNVMHYKHTNTYYATNVTGI